MRFSKRSTPVKISATSRPNVLQATLRQCADVATDNAGSKRGSVGHSRPAESANTEVARVVVIYALLMAFSAPFWGRFVDRHGKPRAFIVAGMVLSGLALLLVPAWPGVAVTALGVALFGLAQASSMPAQVTLMYKVTEAECQRHGRATVLGLFRFGERLGSICGPVVMGGVVGAWGYSAGIMGAGGLALASCLVFIGLFGLLPGGSATRHGG